MNYTNSLDSLVHAATGHAMHTDTAAIPTVWSDKDANSIIWSMMEVLNSAGIEGKTFNPDDPDTYQRFVKAIRKLIITDAVPRFTTGVVLPASNIGPIWHDDYNSLMTWQVFNANGANYTGYASILVGSLLADTQPTPRRGYVKSGVTNLSRTAYAALRGWAMHNGVLVAAGVWAAGAIAMKDNADGTTFTVYDVRGEFPRFWDDARGADPLRGFGTFQAFEVQSHDHAAQGSNGFWVDAPGLYTVNASGAIVNMNRFAKTSLTGGTETRPRNTAFLAAIKF